jgi:hypothetical protein
MSDKGHTEARGSGQGRDGIDEGDLDGAADDPTGRRADRGAQGAEEPRELDQFDAIGRELARMMRQASESAEQIRADAAAEAERTLARAEAAVQSRLRAVDDEAELRRQQLEAELEPTRAEARASLDEAHSLLEEAQDLDRITRANAAMLLESAATRRAAVDEASTSLAALLAAVDETIAGWHANAATTREAIAGVSSRLSAVVDQPDPDLVVEAEAAAPEPDEVIDLTDDGPLEVDPADVDPADEDPADVDPAGVDLTDDGPTIDLRDPDPRYADLPAPPLAPAPPRPPAPPAPPAAVVGHVEGDERQDASADSGDEVLRASVRTAVSRAVDTFMTDMPSAG